MEQFDFQSLLGVHSTSPAFTRGMAVLALLDSKPRQTLDEIARAVKLPKASAFRLLESMQQAGLVRKTPAKQYVPLWVLRPATNERVLYRDRIRGILSELATQTGCTAEWYESESSGLKLVVQQRSEGELQVSARPGYIRLWGEEMDAVACLGYAFDVAAPQPAKTLRAYEANGRKRPLLLKRALERIAKARTDSHAWDAFYNTNGVRRFAVAVMDNQTFRGVLALAEGFHFLEKKSSPEFFIQKITKALSKI